MSHELAVALSIAGWMFSFLVVLAFSGAWVPDGRLARLVAARWWFVGPGAIAVLGAMSALILPGWGARGLCGAASVLAGGVFVVARPGRRRVLRRRRHGSEWFDPSVARRHAILAAALVVYGVGIYLVLRAQA